MHVIAYFMLFGPMLVFAIAQIRFIDAYIVRFGGQSRDQLSWTFFRDLRRYLAAMNRPPFSWSSYFRAVDDPTVERRRRLLVRSIWAIPAGVVIGLLLLAVDPSPLPDWVIPLIVLVAGGSWAVGVISWLWRSARAR